MSGASAIVAEELRDYVSRILSAEGLPGDDAELVADSLVDANLRGVDSHGISRVPIYVERIRRGLVKVDPDVRVVGGRAAALHIDGDNGLGQIVLSRAFDLGLERLDELGSVTLSISNSNHYGAGAYFARRAALAGALVMLMGNAPSTMAAWGGRKPYLGTNPFTFAAPSGSEEPLLLDMATSVVARGKIILAAQLGQAIPEGWAVDASGNSTTDPQAALAGSVLPFGGPKGYGIGLMVEIMSAMLSGARSGPEIGDLYEDLEHPQGVGAFVQLVSPDAFGGGEQFGGRMVSLAAGLKATAAEGGEVFMPGEIEGRTTARRRAEGIPVPDEVLTVLEGLNGIPAPISARVEV